MTLALHAPLFALQTAATRADTATADSVVVESPLPGGAAAAARFLFSTVPQWLQVGGAILGAIAAVALIIILWRRRTAMASWFGARSRGWKAGFAAIVLVLFAGVGFVGLKAWNFMMHDNSFCSGCHVMATPFRRFTASEHSQLGCHDCHRQGMSANVRQLYEWVAERPERIGQHAPVPNVICAECHIQSDPDSIWQRIIATAGHRVHLNPASPAMRRVECVTCHGAEVHRFEPAQETCAQSGCHDAIRIELGRMAAQTSLHCSTCHEFTVAAGESNPMDSVRAAFIPGQERCLECHEMRERMRDFAPENDPHGARCGDCHNPHTQTTPAGAFQSCATSQCHARADTLTTMHRGLTRHRLENCGACHAAHTWTREAVECTDCHTGISDPAVRTRPPDPAHGSAAPVPMAAPHARDAGVSPPGSLFGAMLRPPPLIPAAWSPARLAAALPASPAAGRARWRSHSALGTTDGPGAAAPSTASPDSRLPSHESRVAQGRDTARFEHARHRSVSCTTCHNADIEHGALKAGVARACSACHHGNTALGQDCTRCHTTAEMQGSMPIAANVSLAVWREPRARELPFAHERHRSLACADCHAQTDTRAVTTTCASCHARHHEATRTCASCHPPALETHSRELHLSGCATSGCHTGETTAAITPVRAVCVACHARQQDHKPGRECAPCHMSTWTATGRRAQ